MVVFNTLKNIFAVLGFIGSVMILLFVISPKSHEWEWSEKSKIESPSKLVSAVIEIGTHPDAVDRVRVVLKNQQGKFKELWSSYDKTNPTINWIDDTGLLITYKKEESHSFWPSVKLDNTIYNVSLKYRIGELR